MKLKILAISTILLIITYSCNSGMNANSATIEASAIIKQINKNKAVVYKDAVIKGTLDFTQVNNKALENINVGRAYISVPVTFINCTFENPVKAFAKDGDKGMIACTFEKNLSFVKCTFNDEVNFRETIVNGHTNFASCTFKKTAAFEGISLMAKNAFFAESVFEGEARFQSTFVNGSVSFMKVVFKDNVYFAKSKFGSDAQFGAIECLKAADFNSVNASGNFLCRYAKFRGYTSFNNSNFNQLAEFNEMEVNTIDYTESTFAGISKWNDTKVSDKIILIGAAFVQSNPADAVFKLETNASIQRKAE